MPQDYLLVNRCSRCQAQDFNSRFKYYRCSECGSTIFLCENCSQNLVCDKCKEALIEQPFYNDIYETSVNELTPKEVKAIKEYLGKYKIAVPVGLRANKDLYNQNTSSKEQYEAFTKFNQCLPKPIWPYRYTPMFNRMWEIYVQNYGKTNYSEELLHCVEKTSDSLIKASIDGERRPKLLLGYVQSGKTNAFELVISRCFDLGFNVCIILTANNNNLLSQTFSRINRDFAPISGVYPLLIERISNMDKDVLNRKLERAHEESRIILLVTKNKTRLEDLSHLSYLRKKNVLIIDDEADIISRGYDQTNSQKELARCAYLIDQIRRDLYRSAYLAVTATCYNLILQPKETVTISHNGHSFPLEPFNPSEVFILPSYPGYKGVKDFFGSAASIRYQRELNIGKNKQYDLLIPILTYLVGSAILNIKNCNFAAKRTCCAVHLFIEIPKHEQCRTKIDDIIGDIINDRIPEDVYNVVINDFSKTCRDIPQLNEIKDWIRRNYIAFNIKVLNSENDCQFDDHGQIALEGICNIFIGGYMIDRGITLDHMITFIYGRDPHQRDTVIQHARFFGNRLDMELDVTRIFMIKDTYSVMSRMHLMDEELRDVIRQTPAGASIWIKRSSAEQVCSKMKVLASDIKEFKPYARFSLPKGMQINNQTVLSSNTRIYKILQPYLQNKNQFISIPTADILNILKAIKNSYAYGPQYNNADLSDELDNIIKGLKSICKSKSLTSLPLLLFTNRNMSRGYPGNWSTGVLTGHHHGHVSDSENAKKLADSKGKPVIVLTQQNGSVQQGWTGRPFYWPVLVLPYSLITDQKFIQVNN